MEDVLMVSAEGGVMTLLMNRPEKRNALNRDLVDALSEAIENAAAEPGVRVVLLRGAGPDFCAGADLAELEAVTRKGADASLEDAEALGELLLRMRRLPKPVVAGVHGRALAGGCGLATACDLIIAQEDAEFGYPEVHLGFVPAMVMAILRRKLTEGRAFELVSLGRRIPASEAHAIGLVNRVFLEGTFQEGLHALVTELAARPPGALGLTKGLLYELADLPVAGGIQRGAEVNVEARMSEECKEGVRDFLSRRKSPPS